MQQPPVVLQREADIRMRERDAAERLVAMAPFGGFGAQELPPRGRVEIELLRRSPSCRRRSPPAPSDRRCRRRPRCATRAALPAARDASANRDTAAIDASASPRKPSVAIASRSSAVASFDVACRSTASASSSRRDARAVVGDADAPDAAAFDIHVDLRRARIERVLEQLLQRRRRALDDLARGDLVDEVVGQRLNPCHGKGRSTRKGTL